MLGAADKPHAEYPHVYAIVRFNSDMSGEKAAIVVKVIPSKEVAEREAARLNQVSLGKNCTYSVQTTRFVENLET